MIINRKEIFDDDGSLGYIEAIYESSNILKTIYFPKKELLYIMFTKGQAYSYVNITKDLYNEFENSESHGKFFYQHIRNKEEFQYRKEFTLYESELKEIKNIIENSTE